MQISTKTLLYMLFYLFNIISVNFQLPCLAQVDETNSSLRNPSSIIRLQNKYVFDVLPMNLEEVTDSADRIFSGTCISIEEIIDDPISHLEVVKYTFSIEDGVKGVGSQDQISFKQWKPTTKSAGFSINKKYIVFLYPDSTLGLTSPAGFQQGTFLVEKQGLNRGVTYIKNSVNNIGLYRNLRTQRTISIKTDSYLNNYISECSEQGKPIKYKEFVSAVRHLVKNQ